MINPMCFDGFEPLLDFKSWLNEKLYETKMPVCVLAKLSGVRKQSIIGYRYGRHEPSLYAVRAICRVFNYTLGVVPSKESKYVSKQHHV